MVFVPLRLVHTTLRICCNLRHKVAFLQGDRKLLYLQCCSPLRQWQQPATSVNKPLGSCTYLCTFKRICLFDHIRFDIPTKILRIHHQQQQQHHHHQLHQQLYKPSVFLPSNFVSARPAEKIFGVPKLLTKTAREKIEIAHLELRKRGGTCGSV